MIDPRPIGGTHPRSGCQSCGGAWHVLDEALIRTRFGDGNPDVLLCYSCLELTWGEGIGDTVCADSPPPQS